MKIENGDLLIGNNGYKYIVLKGNQFGVIENTGINPIHNSFSKQQTGIKTEYITVFDGKFLNKISIEDVDRLYTIHKTEENIINHFNQLYIGEIFNN